jgi:hypothetical protein
LQQCNKKVLKGRISGPFMTVLMPALGLLHAKIGLAEHDHIDPIQGAFNDLFSFFHETWCLWRTGWRLQTRRFRWPGWRLQARRIWWPGWRLQARRIWWPGWRVNPIRFDRSLTCLHSIFLRQDPAPPADWVVVTSLVHLVAWVAVANPAHLVAWVAVASPVPLAALAAVDPTASLTTW